MQRSANEAARSMPFTAVKRASAKPMDLLSITQSDINAMPNHTADGTPGDRQGGAPDPDAVARVKTMFLEWFLLCNENLHGCLDQGK